MSGRAAARQIARSIYLSPEVKVGSSAAAGANLAAFNDAAAFLVSKGGGVMNVPPGNIYTSARWTVPAGVRLVGAGMGITKLIGTTGDRVLVLEDDAAAHDLTVDAQDLQPSETSVVMCKSRTVLRSIEAKNGYTGFAWGDAAGQYGAQAHSLRSIGMASRGFQLDPFATANTFSGLYAEDCGAAGLLIAHGSYRNVITGYVARELGSVAVWIHESAHDNVVKDFVAEGANVGTLPAISIDQGCYDNHVSVGNVKGYGRVAQFIGGFIDGNTPGAVDRDTSGNVVERIIAIGSDNTNTNNDAVWFQQDGATAPNATNNVVRDCTFDNYYSAFRNISDAANGADISDIKTRNIGAGGIMKRMRSMTDSIRIRNVEGYRTKTKLSGTLAVDSTGEKTLTLNHNLGIIVPDTAVTVSLARESTVNDFVLRYGPWVVQATDLVIGVRIYVVTASATAGATVQINIDVDMQADESFPLSAIPI